MANDYNFFLLMKLFLVFFLFLFVIFGLDVRTTEKESKRFVSASKILLMKVSAFFLVFLYLVSIVFVDSCDIYDFVTLAFTTIGVAIIYWAKKSLGSNFTWTGYYLPDAEIIKTGPYRFLSHPLYFGVYLFEFGAFIRYLKFTALSDYQIIWVLLGVIPLIYAVIFNLVMSRYESRMINNKQ